jgi:hypothetical protein
VVTNSLKKSISLIDLQNSFNSINKILVKNKINIENFNNYIENLNFNLDTFF